MMSGNSGKRAWGFHAFASEGFFRRAQRYSIFRRNGMLRWICLGLLWILPLSGCATTYRGKVIDADTREPIEGAVVVAYWLEARATVAGESTRLEEVKEALTDKEGKWSISGPRGQEGCNPVLLLTFLTGAHYTREPGFIVFKPGFCSFPGGFSIDACRGKLKPGGAGGIYEGKNVEMPRLTEREDRLKARRIAPLTDGDEKTQIEFLKKQKELLRLLNEEARNLGLEEIKFYKELRYEK
jgi:hypothetical protein